MQSTGKHKIAVTRSASRSSPSNAAMARIYRANVAAMLAGDERPPRGRSQQRAHDGARRGRLVQRVEMNTGRAAAQEIRRLKSGIRYAQVLDGLGFVSTLFQRGEQFGWYQTAAERAHARDLLIVRNWHQPGENRHRDSRGSRTFHKRKILFVVEEKLRN